MESFKFYFDLFLTFMKIGGFTVGGGYAMIPIIQNEAVDKKKWVTEEEFTDFITLAQSLPGVVGINVATCIGNKLKGIKGALTATLGMVIPSLTIIILVAAVYDELIKNTVLQNAFKGVRATVVALIFYAVIRLYKSAVTENIQILIVVICFVLVFFLKISPPYLVVASALGCIILKPATNKNKRKGE